MKGKELLANTIYIQFNIPQQREKNIQVTTNIRSWFKVKIGGWLELCMLWTFSNFTKLNKT